ncbi:MAG: outer membrane beta-barrel protein [Lutibacter sp.]
MKINKLVLLLSILFPISLLSQVQLTGVVKNSIEPIEFSNVVVTDTQNNIVSGTITDSNGNFNLIINKGNYRLNISFLGFVNWTKEISLTENFDFGTIILKEDNNALAEVVIIAKKPLIEQKVDRIVFNVADNSFAKGKNALKTIGLAPMVWVSSKGDISINGRGGVGIVVNGKLLSNDISKSYLSSLRSEDIESIEIIPDPPAEYEAQSQSGIINIILKKNIQNGLNGSINASYSQQKYASYNSGGSLNYKTGNWLWYGSYNYSQNKDFFDREVETFYEPDNNVRLTNFQSIERSFSNSYRFGFDYDMNSKHKIGVEYYTSNLNFDEAIDNEAKSITNNVLEEIVKGEYPGNLDKLKQQSTLNYKWEIDSLGRSLTFISDYLIYSRDRKSDYFDAIYDENNTFLNLNTSRGIVNSDINVFTSKIDYTQPNKKGSIQGGLKFSDADLENQNIHTILLNGFYEIDPQKTTAYQFNEKVSAAYLKVTSKIKEIDVQLGVRGEYTQNKLESISEKNYFSVFPSVFVRHYINKEKNTSLGYYYGRKISRPSYNLMSPYEYLIDKYTVFRGNEDLKPQFNNTFSLTYYIGNKYSFRSYYSYVKDVFNIVEFRSLKDTNINVETTENIGESYSYGFHSNNTIKIAKWWNTNTGLGVNYTKILSYDKSFETGKFYYYINNRSFINLPLKIDCIVNSRYISPMSDGIYEFGDKFSFDIGFQKEILKDKGLISLDISDVFYTEGKYHLTSNYKDQYSRTNVNRPGQIIMLSFSYNFSSGSKFKKQRKEQSNEDEVQRI